MSKWLRDVLSFITWFSSCVFIIFILHQYTNCHCCGLPMQDIDREMEKGQQRAYRAHCLVLPYPDQGHINPMLQFSKHLEHKGVKVTLVTTRFLCKTMHRSGSSNIPLETISDGFDQGGRAEAGSIDVYLESLRISGSQTLAELLEKLSSSGLPVDCIVYDAFLSWPLDIAKKFGILGAIFFTQSCAVNTIYYHVKNGLLKLPVVESEISLPGFC